MPVSAQEIRGRLEAEYDDDLGGTDVAGMLNDVGALLAELDALRWEVEVARDLAFEEWQARMRAPDSDRPAFDNLFAEALRRALAEQEAGERSISRDGRQGGRE